MIDFLIRLLPYIAPAIRYADDQNRDWWRFDLLVFTLTIWFIDIVLAHTTMVPAFGWPKGKELTISDTLERLIFSKSIEQVGALKLARAIDVISPGHIKNLKIYDQSRETSDGT